jgi:hypothetical protein
VPKTLDETLSCRCAGCQGTMKWCGYHLREREKSHINTLHGNSRVSASIDLGMDATRRWSQRFVPTKPHHHQKHLRLDCRLRQYCHELCIMCRCGDRTPRSPQSVAIDSPVVRVIRGNCLLPVSNFAEVSRQRCGLGEVLCSGDIRHPSVVWMLMSM